MDDSTLRAALRPEVHADRRMLAALDAGANRGGEAANEAIGARTVWPRRVRHLARRGLLLDDEAATLSDLSDLAALDESYTVITRLLRLADGEQVHTVLLHGSPPGVRVAFAHRLPRFVEVDEDRW